MDEKSGGFPDREGDDGDDDDDDDDDSTRSLSEM